jgi:hypothetical protein
VGGHHHLHRRKAVGGLDAPQLAPAIERSRMATAVTDVFACQPTPDAFLTKACAWGEGLLIGYDPAFAIGVAD